MKTEEKSSPNAMDLVSEKFSEEICDLINKMSELNDNKYNMIILLNLPFTMNNIAAMLFSKHYCVDPTSGKHQLDFDKFNSMSDDKKSKEIKAILDTILGLIKSMDQLKIGMVELAQQLYEINKNLKIESQN